MEHSICIRSHIDAATAYYTDNEGQTNTEKHLDSFCTKKSQQMPVLILTFNASYLTVGEMELFSL